MKSLLRFKFSFCYLIHYTLSGLTSLSRKWLELACSVRWSAVGGKIGGTGGSLEYGLQSYDLFRYSIQCYDNSRVLPETWWTMTPSDSDQDSSLVSWMRALQVHALRPFSPSMAQLPFGLGLVKYKAK